VLFTQGVPTHTALAVYSVHPNQHPGLQSDNLDISIDLSKRRASLQQGIQTLSLSLTHHPQIQLAIRDSWMDEREPGEDATLHIQKKLCLFTASNDSLCCQPEQQSASSENKADHRALTQGTYKNQEQTLAKGQHLFHASQLHQGR